MIDKIKAHLEQHRDRIAGGAPKGYDVDRLIGMAAHVVAENKNLQGDKSSLVDALTKCAGAGLYLHDGEAYLVPRKGRVNFEAGYRGLIRLATMHPDVETVWATLVYAGDVFSATGGDEPKITHEFNPFASDRGDLVGVYATARFASGRLQHEIMSMAEIDEIRTDGTGRFSPWQTHEGEMVKKSAVKRLVKYLPRTAEQSRALEYASTPYVEPDTDDAPSDPTAIPAAQEPKKSKADAAIERVRAKLPEQIQPIAVAMIECNRDGDLTQAFADIKAIADGEYQTATRPACIDACAEHGADDALVAYVAEAAEIEAEIAQLALAWCAQTGIAWSGAIEKANKGVQPPAAKGES